MALSDFQSFSKNYSDLLGALNRKRVKYLIVGGWARNRYTEPRNTKDLDVWVERSAQNADRLYRALIEFGGPVGRYKPADFIEPYGVFRIGTSWGHQIDILAHIDGVRFSSAWRNRKRTEVSRGLFAPFISRADLVKAKRAAGRPRDLADVEDLLGRS